MPGSILDRNERQYRWLASKLRGFDKAKPKHRYRRFVETGGVVEVQAERIIVHFDKRSHNPLEQCRSCERGL